MIKYKLKGRKYNEGIILILNITQQETTVINALGIDNNFYSITFVTEFFKFV